MTRQAGRNNFNMAYTYFQVMSLWIGVISNNDNYKFNNSLHYNYPISYLVRSAFVKSAIRDQQEIETTILGDSIEAKLNAQNIDVERFSKLEDRLTRIEDKTDSLERVMMLSNSTSIN